MAIRHFPDDTIAAISTPLGEGGLGVIRLSGREAIPIADRIFMPKSGRSVRHQKSFTAQVGHIVAKRPQSQENIIDEALVLVMRAPKSYTREDVVEISAHGGSEVLRAILDLVVVNGARLAEKGEFTKRAFLNGRIDLLQAEAVLDLVQAKTDRTREWASEGLKRGLSLKIDTFKKELVGLLSHLEASIDFPDDFPETDSPARMEAQLGGVAADLEAVLRNAEFAIVIKKGVRVALVGRPNVGKSSILNELARANRAIVTPFPGTTRDVVEEEIQVRGIPLRLMDTAGIQETSNPIENEGVERARRAAEDAGFVIYVMDGSQPLEGEEEALLSSFSQKARIVAVNKTDLPEKLDLNLLQKKLPESEIIRCSCVKKGGLGLLEESIFRFISRGKSQISDVPLVNSVRQKELLSQALQNIQDARTSCRGHASPELIAVDVRLALDRFGALVGEAVTDDVLEALFSQFCIGK